MCNVSYRTVGTKITAAFSPSSSLHHTMPTGKEEEEARARKGEGVYLFAQ